MRRALSHFLFTTKAGSFLPHFSNSRVFAGHLLLLLLTLFAATASGQPTCPDGDVDGDCIVDVNDLMIVAGDWLESGIIPANIDGLGDVDWDDFAILAGDWGTEQTSEITLRINEFMATNTYTPVVSPLEIETHYAEIPDVNVHPDWIELYNSDTGAVSLEGWYLTDNRENLTKWRFPAGVTIAADGYLVVFASNKEQVDYPGNYPFVDYDGALHTNFELNGGGEYLALVQPDGVTIAHEYNKYPKQRGLISYGIASDETPGYLLSPTPGTRVSNEWTGAANSARYLGVVADTQFSNDRGFYESAFNVTISSNTSGAVIRYTLDGSTPTLGNGFTYSSPINISTTTCLRAAAFKTDWLETNVDTQTYIFLDDVLNQNGAGFPDTWGHNGADYEMDPAVVASYSATIKDDLLTIATVSLVMDVEDWFNGSSDPSVGGIYANPRWEDDYGEEAERHVSVEFIDPVNGGDFQLNAGVRIQGGSSTSGWKSDKLSIRLKFKGGYGPSKLNYPLYGKDAADSFNTLLLDARLNNAWNYGNDNGQRERAQYTRDQYVADIQNAMGGFGPHGRHVHLYINGLYWGLYNLHERPDDAFAESYFGGDAYDYDVFKHDPYIDEDPNDGVPDNLVNGSIDFYDEMFAISRAGLSGATEYLDIQQYLDVPHLIDYMMTNFYVGNTDWDNQNWYATGNRRSLDGRWRYHSWDAEHVLKSVTTSTGFGDNTTGAPSELHRDLMANEEYLMLFADHLHRHFNNGGVLSVEGATALYQNRLDVVDRAVVGESARWGDNREDQPTYKTYTRDVDWVAERDWLLGTYFPARTSFVLNEHGNRGLWPSVDPPTFYEDGGSYQHGGAVPTGFDLEITAPDGTIYYTLDDSDPRATGGAAVGTEYTAPITLTKSVVVRARLLDSGTWSALNEATFAVGPVFENLRITELMYHPTDPTPTEITAIGDPNLIDEDFEFIELKNIGGDDINLNLVRFTDGIDFTFGDYILDAGEYAVLLKHQAAFAARYNTGGINIVPGSYTGSLSNGGEEIVLRDAVGAEIHDFDYNDTWYDITDGSGFSLTIKDPDATDPNLWDEKAGWRPSAAVDGSPGWDDTGDIPEIGDIVINEILAHSDSDPNDWIELHNTTGSPINIGDWYLSDDAGDLTKYKIAPGTSIAAGGYIVFTQDDDFGGAFALSENGETLYLHSGDGSGITGYSREEKFDASESEIAFGRYEKSTGTFNFVAMSTNTPGTSYEGAANAYPKVGPIVINEIMYHPTDGGGDAEYIELLNISGGSETLYDGSTSEPWKMTDGIQYTFPSGSPTTIAAGDYYLLIKDLTAFTAEYGAPVCAYAEWTSGSLSNGGEKVEISMPGDEVLGVRQYIRVDRVNYSDGSHPVGDDPWPTRADGDGKSLSRKVSADYGNDVANWWDVSKTPGIVNAVPLVPIIINTPAANITSISATLTGEVTDDGGDDPAVTVYWGDNDGGTTPGNWDNAETIGTQYSTFIVDISSLLADTTYYFRAYASNIAGSDWASPTASFTTIITTVPAVTVSLATDVTSGGATFHGDVTATGGEIPSVTFYYGDEDGGASAGGWDNSISIGTQASTFSTAVSTLAGGTTYYYRAVATNLAGSDWSGVTSFTTASSVPIAFDADSSDEGNTDALSWPHTLGSGTNRVVVVVVGTENGGSFTGVTFNGVSMTLAAGSTQTNDSNITAIFYMLEADLPSAGSYTVVVSMASSNRVAAGAVSLENVSQSPPEAVETATKGSGDGDYISGNITTLTDGAWIVDVVGSGDSTSFYTDTVDPPQVEFFDYNPGSSTVAGSTREVPTAGTVTNGWTTDDGNTRRRCLSMAAFAPN